jgi:hypothetical protein
MHGNDRYFRVILPRIKAIIAINENMEAKTIECDNYEVCYYSNVLENGRCPKYCMVVVEAKHYARGRRKSKVKVQEVNRSEIIDKLRPVLKY